MGKRIALELHSVTMGGNVNDAVVHDLMAALARHDVEGLERCYHPDVSYGDPMFPELEGRDRVLALWRMVFDRTTGLRVAHRAVTTDKYRGSAACVFTYVIAESGREIETRTEALFHFEDGLIVRHHNEYDFRHWSKVVLGRPTGLISGWTPRLRDSIRSGARKALQAYDGRPIQG